LQIGINSSASHAFSAMDNLGDGIIARANALNVSLEGSIGEIARRITSLQNHQAALAAMQPIIDQQMQNYVNPNPTPAPTNSRTAQQEWFYQLFGTANADTIDNIIRTFDTLAGFGSQLAFGVQDYISDIGNGGNKALLTDAPTQQGLYDLGQENVGIDVLTQAIFSLIAELRQTGGSTGTSFNLNLAPTATGNLYADAGTLITYLRTLYAS
jgi:hypothetical protein